MAGVIFLIEQVATGLYIIAAVALVLVLRSWFKAGSAYRGTYFELEKDIARYQRGTSFTALILLVEFALIIVGIQRVVAPTLRASLSQAQQQQRVINFASDGTFRTPIPPTFSAAVIDASGVQLDAVDPANLVLPTPTLTPTPVGTIVANAPPAQCASPDAQLQIPANGMVVFEPINVVGVANSENFGFYRFELKGELTSGNFATIGVDGTQSMVEMGQLGQFVPSFYTPGEYQFRVSVFDTSSAPRASCTVTIYISEPICDTDSARHGRATLIPTLAVVGAGKVGTALARLLYGRGYRVTTVYSRTLAHAETLAQSVKARAVESLDDIDADLVLLTVPDDAIASVAAALAASRFEAKAVVHTSGVRDASSLAALNEVEIQVGSLQPAYPFADVTVAEANLPGLAFAIEVGVVDGELLRGWLLGIVEAMGGRPLMILPNGKALYHAALTIASNYTVTLYALAERLLTELGADKAAADYALDALLAGTVENLHVRGTPDALTGALVRGDVGTIAAHLKALDGVDSDVQALYIQLARLTYPLLKARGVATDEIEALLKDTQEDAHDSP